MNDMQYRVDSYIVENGYRRADNNSKKRLVETGMKKYMLEKISEIDSKKAISTSNLDDVSLQELALVLGEVIPEEMHDVTLPYLTHYVIGVIGFIQGDFVKWDVSEDFSFVDTPLIENDQDGKWRRLVTHKMTSHLKTFNLALDKLDQAVALKNTRDSEFVKSIVKLS